VSSFVKAFKSLFLQLKASVIEPLAPCSKGCNLSMYLRSAKSNLCNVEFAMMMLDAMLVKLTLSIYLNSWVGVVQVD
jgi:hypothetical protein